MPFIGRGVVLFCIINIKMQMMKRTNNKKFPGIHIIGVGGTGSSAVNYFKECFEDEVIFSVYDIDRKNNYKTDKPSDNDSETVFIVTGLGGEFGTRVAPAIAHECKTAGKTTIGVATLPFSFEGNIKYERALQGANELSRNTDAIFLLNNQSILKNNREMSISEAFKKRDHMLCQIIKSINSSIISTETTDSNILGCLKWLKKTYNAIFVKHSKENKNIK